MQISVELIWARNTSIHRGSFQDYPSGLFSHLSEELFGESALWLFLFSDVFLWHVIKLLAPNIQGSLILSDNWALGTDLPTTELPLAHIWGVQAIEFSGWLFPDRVHAWPITRSQSLHGAFSLSTWHLSSLTPPNKAFMMGTDCCSMLKC